MSALKLDWLELSNEFFEWGNRNAALDRLHELFGKSFCPDAASLDQLFSTLKFVREQINAIHFAEETDWKQINSRLEGMSLRYSRSGDGLPPLRANSDPQTDSERVQQLSNTVLLHFAIFLSQFESKPNEGRISRCEGLFRPDVSISPIDESERKWRMEIPDLGQSGLTDSPEIQRCGDFFISAKARFCSESCRFRTFQIAKQLKDPQYLANKQKRYRERKAADRPQG